MQPADPTFVKHFWETDLFKILATAIVTVSFIEPVKVWLNNYFKRRTMRRSVLAEVGLSLSLLRAIIDECKQYSDTNLAIRMNRLQVMSHEIQQIAYDNALKDYYLFSQTPECRWISRLYWAVSKVQSLSALSDSFAPSPIKPPTSIELLDLCEKHLDVAIGEINARPSTRRIMGEYGTPFIKERLHPKPLGMLMRQSWQELGAKVEEVKAKSERPTT